MPVDFLTAEQQRRYGRYAGEPSPAQLGRYFHLDDADLALLIARGAATTTGWASPCNWARSGSWARSSTDPTEVPAGVVAHLARQLAIADLTCLATLPGAAGHAPGPRRSRSSGRMATAISPTSRGTPA